jgi:hypothetical protein
MSSKKFLFYWMVISIFALIASIALLAATFSAAQALDGRRSNAFQGTPPAPTVVVPTVVVTNLPPVTLVAPTVIIPNTGGDTVIIDFFSNWALWAVLGVLVIVLLIALAARPGGPVDPHHHHDL